MWHFTYITVLRPCWLVNSATISTVIGHSFFRVSIVIGQDEFTQFPPQNTREITTTPRGPPHNLYLFNPRRFDFLITSGFSCWMRDFVTLPATKRRLLPLVRKLKNSHQTKSIILKTAWGIINKIWSPLQQQSVSYSVAVHIWEWTLFHALPCDLRPTWRTPLCFLLTRHGTSRLQVVGSSASTTSVLAAVCWNTLLFWCRTPGTYMGRPLEPSPPLLWSLGYVWVRIFEWFSFYRRWNGCC